MDAKQTNNMGSFREMLKQAKEEHATPAQTTGNDPEGQAPPVKDISQSPGISQDDGIDR